MSRKIKVIITGSTGMVGEGVMHVCLKDPSVDKVLVINRKPVGVQHEKLVEVIHNDFFDLSPIESLLTGYDACFFCLGVSSVGMKQSEYFRITYTLTMHVAETLSRLNNNMVFCYISGVGTDSSEQGRIHWARVKGKTENDLLNYPFKKVYGLRPGFIKPIKGLTRTHGYYKYLGWLFPLGRALYPNGFCTLQELGRCMLTLAAGNIPKHIITGKEIILLGKETGRE